MSLSNKITAAIKEAMKAKNQNALRGLRAIKSAILLEQTKEGAGENLSEAVEIKLLQKLAKQRKDSLAIFKEQGRDDLAEKEEQELAIIQPFLPEPMSEADLKTALQKIIADTGAESMKDMGKVMGIASQQIGAKADGKTISNMVKQLLNT